MGFLFTKEGTQRIVDTLNTAFNEKGLALIQQEASNPTTKLYALVGTRNWGAGQLALMLNLLPYDQSGKKEKIKKIHIQKWFYFLRKVLGGNTSAFTAIRSALADAILNRDSSNNQLNIVRVSFNCVELPPKTNSNVVIFDAPLPGNARGGTVRQITLFTTYVGENDSDPVGWIDPNNQDPPNPDWKTSDPNNPDPNP